MGKVPNRLYGPAQLGNSDAELFAGAAATRTIIRHIRLTNPTGGAVTVTLSIGADAAATRLYDAFSIAAGGVEDRWCYYVVEAAESVRGHASAATSIVAIINGDKYTL